MNQGTTCKMLYKITDVRDNNQFGYIFIYQIFIIAFETNAIVVYV